jgi:hypothetical protein
MYVTFPSLALSPINCSYSQFLALSFFFGAFVSSQVKTFKIVSFSLSYFFIIYNIAQLLIFDFMGSINIANKSFSRGAYLYFFYQVKSGISKQEK